jgi:Na+-transporting NADH:ubiquinone oxidoreductase subunit C
VSDAHAKRRGGLFSLPNDDPRKIVAVAVTLCLVCSVAVSSAAVLLRPLQERNEELALKREILKVAELYRPGEDVEALFGQVEVRVVDLATGEYAPEIDPETFDQRDAARDPGLSAVVAPERDIANIKRRAKYAPVYLVRESGRVKLIVIPVHGYGLWSTMYGLLALEPDARTIAGLTFYEHAETAGLGSEITNPSWLAKWEGKLAVDAQGDPRIRVIKGSVQEQAPAARYQVDGLAGATLTSNGVTNLIHYWLGEQGFKPYLDRIRGRGA